MNRVEQLTQKTNQFNTTTIRFLKQLLGKKRRSSNVMGYKSKKEQENIDYLLNTDKKNLKELNLFNIMQSSKGVLKIYVLNAYFNLLCRGYKSLIAKLIKMIEIFCPKNFPR